MTSQLALRMTAPVPEAVLLVCTCGEHYARRFTSEGRIECRHPDRPLELTTCIACQADLNRVWRQQAKDFIPCPCCHGTTRVRKTRVEIGCMVCDLTGRVHPVRAAWLQREIDALAKGERHPYLPSEDPHAQPQHH